MREPSSVEMTGDDNSATFPSMVHIQMSLKQCMYSTEYIGYVLQVFIHIYCLRYFQRAHFISILRVGKDMRILIGP